MRFDPHAIILVRSEDEIFFIGFAKEINIFFSLDPSKFLDLPLHLDIIRRTIVHLRMAYQYTIKECIETKIVFKYRILQLFHMLLKVLLNSIVVEHRRILPDIMHNFNHYVEGFGD